MNRASVLQRPKKRLVTTLFVKIEIEKGIPQWN